MRKKVMVISDMDGTLLRSDNTISQETQTYLKSIQDRGVDITLASGRPFRGLINYYNQIGLKGKLVCYNGGLIIDPQQNNKIINANTYPLELIERIIKVVGIDNFENFIIENNDDIFIANRDDHSMDSFIYINTSQIKVHYEKDPSKFEGDIYGGIFVLKNESDIQKFMEAGFSIPGIGVRFWDNCLIAELYFTKINKYTAIEIVGKKAGISPENFICFGDAANDMEMLYRSGIGVAMKNGNKVAKKYADVISFTDNNNDGVMNTLKVLINAYI
jgi:Cof subfamily protein (haloacid dehalogenase superfamily)